MNIETVKKYLAEVKAEMKVVTWPEQKDLINMTIVVMGLSLVLAVFIGAVDKSFVELIMRTLG